MTRLLVLILLVAAIALPTPADAKARQATPKLCLKVFEDNKYRFGFYVGPVYRFVAWRCG